MSNNGGKLLSQTFANDTQVFLYHGDSRVALEFMGQLYYYVYNLQGDVVGLVDKTGATMVTYKYDVWGKPESTTGPMATTLGVANPFRYRGYYYDTESGFYYLQSRYYDPEVGRFLNADGILGANQDILSYNLYAYCSNNPVNLSDPTGMCPYNGTIADFHRMGKGLPSIDCNCWRNPLIDNDGGFALYDNKRHDSDSVFHEQILSGKVSKPAFNPQSKKVTLGSAKVSLMTGGWEWEHLDLSILDVGTAKVSLGYENDELDISAMASIWTPSVTIKVWDISITLSGHVGSVGGHLNLGNGKFKAEAAYGYGVGISVDW